MEAVAVPLVENFEDGGEDGGVLTSGSTDGDTFAWVKEIVGGDGVVDFGFEGGEEAGLTELLVVFGADDDGARCLTMEAWCRRHDG